MDAKDKACIFCGVREKGVIQKYGLRICRNCVRDHAYELGFEKVD
ncbi:MAG: 30S ribosomal protein S14 [Euryarchaeota archaeon HGW-Euryarchaeota-1]|nr:MAG: 30S ribosomal protein S14 [Euryarchaeota archaeon HGW-Euryarchaeota-1]